MANEKCISQCKFILLLVAFVNILLLLIFSYSSKYIGNDPITLSLTNQNNRRLDLRLNKSSIAEEWGIERRLAILKSLGQKCIYKPDIDLQRFQGILRTPDSNCGSPFVTVFDGGRLGNQICELMSIWIFRKHFGLRILISNKSYSHYKTLFSKVSVAHGYNKCFNKHHKMVSSFNILYKNFYQSLDLIRKGTPLLSTNISKHNFVSDYPCRTEYFINYRDEIRSLFVFQPDLVKKIERTIVGKLTNINLSRSSVTLISVHVRRKDYIPYTFEHYKSTVPGADFYSKAFDLYSKRFDRAVFVVLSDDIEWCKQNFPSRNVIYPGTGNDEDPSIDFATIAMCDHHIISSGTFSFTSAFLGRGTIAYDASNKSTSMGFVRTFLCSDLKIYIPIY